MLTHTQSLLHKLNKEGKRSKKAPAYAKKGDRIIARLTTSQATCLEKFEDFGMMGRFTLRDQAQTIAIGKVIRLDE